MNAYITKLTMLNNNILATINLNDSLNNTKKQIYAKSTQIKELCKQNIDDNTNLSDEQINTLNELNSSIMANNTRISLTRNEISNYYKSVQSLKDEYSSKPEQLNFKYLKLQTGLNTRLTYYSSIMSSLQNIENVLCKEYKTIDNDIQKTGIMKNIDTYENAGTNIYGDIRNNPVYNKDNYLRNYNPGYGMDYANQYGMNNYGYNGYGMGGYGPMGYAGNMYGYGMMPFRQGYIYPNINSFGTYKNVDTYRSRKDLDKEQININDEQQNDEIINTWNDRPEPLPRPYPRPKPLLEKNDESNIEKNSKPIHNDNDSEDQFVDKQIESNLEEISDNKTVTLEELEHNLPIIDIETKDCENGRCIVYTIKF